MKRSLRLLGIGAARVCILSGVVLLDFSLMPPIAKVHVAFEWCNETLNGPLLCSMVGQLHSVRLYQVWSPHYLEQKWMSIRLCIRRNFDFEKHLGFRWE
jgi:hypothetical protein